MYNVLSIDIDYAYSPSISAYDDHVEGSRISLGEQQKIFSDLCLPEPAVNKEKLEVIKENYFPKGEDTPQPLTEEVENNESDELVEDVDASVSFYANALKRHNNK